MDGCVPTPHPYGPMPPWGPMMPYPPTIPNLYWDVKSHEQRYLLICKNMSAVIKFLEGLTSYAGATAAEVAELKKLFDEFKKSGFEDYYKDQIAEWVNQNMTRIITDAIKMIFFGLTPDGYFTAYIPDSWADITFDTIQDYSSDLYGRLTLSY